jgi:hypothetical protein
MIQPDEKQEMTSEGETCVPAAALAVDGVTPGVGDEFDYQGRGRVTRIAGDKVYLSTTAVNGAPVHAESEAGEPTAEDIMELAQRADMEG